MIYYFDQKARGNSLEIGGKANSLIWLTENGFNVPQGFVITSDMQQDFFERNGIYELIKAELDNLKSDDYSKFSNAAKRVRNAIINSELSETNIQEIQKALKELNLQNGSLYAVRSSAGIEDGKVDSWAGQFDSFLEVQEEDVPDYVKRCWASMFGLRAIKYGEKALLSDNVISFSVIVQQMVKGDYSGIAFSVDPADMNTDHVRIEAVSGTGESAVGGQEIPYAVVMGKQDGVIIRRTFGSQGQVELVKPSILQSLMVEVNRIEHLFGIPVDVEWTVQDSCVFILQARPITTGQAKVVSKEDSLPDILDYELTFKVTGLGFMFADLLCRGFGYLHPLFICSKGEFLQYFTNERMEYAARYGHRWLSSETGFLEYKKNFTNFHLKTFEELKGIVAGNLTVDTVKTFFEAVYDYFVFYSKMDFQFTNLTYLYAEENPVIAENLKRIAAFKDVARVWVNCVSIDDDCFLNHLCDRISEKFGVTRGDLESYKITEIFSLFDGIYVDKEILAARFQNSLAYSDGTVLKYAWGREAELYVEQVKQVYELQAAAEIIGQVANKGEERYVKGKVALINVDYGHLDLMEQYIAKMESGDILVSEFTAPELIQACNKAKAIVTDLGGMLSHAAIVSRELNIPCIVGTKHASRSLKNGDEIIIDVDLGTIKKM